MELIGEFNEIVNEIEHNLILDMYDSSSDVSNNNQNSNMVNNRKVNGIKSNGIKSNIIYDNRVNKINKINVNDKNQHIIDNIVDSKRYKIKEKILRKTLSI